MRKKKQSWKKKRERKGTQQGKKIEREARKSERGRTTGTRNARDDASLSGSHCKCQGLTGKQ